MAAGKQFVQGEPHFYIKRCLFGCPEPCHKTGIEQLTYLMFIRVFPAIKKMKYGRLPDFDENGELVETIDAVRENAVHVTA